MMKVRNIFVDNYYENVLNIIINWYCLDIGLRSTLLAQGCIDQRPVVLPEAAGRRPIQLAGAQFG